MMKLMSKKNKKGFTLVEVIVVLVILAILAAILIPSMTGWIDEANQKTAIVEGRTYVLAAQTIASEAYGLDGATDYTVTGATATATSPATKTPTTKSYPQTTATFKAGVELLANIASTEFTSCTVEKGTITGLVMESSSGKTVTYSSTDGYTVATA